jgi:hypothetical protein
MYWKVKSEKQNSKEKIDWKEDLKLAKHNGSNSFSKYIPDILKHNIFDIITSKNTFYLHLKVENRFGKDKELFSSLYMAYILPW